MAHQVNRVVRHLLRELSGRAQHQRAGRRRLEVSAAGGILTARLLGRRFALGKGLLAGALKLVTLLVRDGRLLTEQGMQHRQQESRGFSAAGLA